MKTITTTLIRQMNMKNGLMLWLVLVMMPLTATAKTYFVHPDQLGTPQVITDENQNVVWQADYNPFGEATISIESITNNLRFAGQYYDQETGLHYNMFRYFDPTIGRYITSDPIGLTAGPNTYTYVRNKPLRYTDRLGLEIDCKWVVTAYYNKVTPRLVQPELGYYDELCIPMLVPTIGAPAPMAPRNRLPFPLDFKYEMECITRWVVVQEAKWESDTELWMSGYMQCTDTCTGETKNYWGADRPADDPPNI